MHTIDHALAELITSSLKEYASTKLGWVPSDRDHRYMMEGDLFLEIEVKSIEYTLGLIDGRPSVVQIINFN